MYGKFSDKVSEILYEWSLDGGCDLEIGSVNDLGWYGLLRGPLHLDDDERHALLESEEDPELIERAAGAILYEDTYGFVWAGVYTTEDALNAAWERIECKYQDYDDE